MAIKYATELKSAQNAFAAMNKDEGKILRPNPPSTPPKVLKITLEENSIKISLLKKLNELLKSQPGPQHP